MSDSTDEYYSALGRFVDSFAMAEAAMQLALWRAAQTDDPTSKAIFSGTRVRQAIDFIKRIAESKGESVPAPVQKAFSHLLAINSMRDNLIHFGASQQPDGSRLITNRFRAHAERSLKEFPISAEMLAQMSHDLAVIVARLVTHYLPPDPNAEPGEWLESLDVARAPFLYKSPQPTKKKSRSRKATQKRKPPPPPSQG